LATCFAAFACHPLPAANPPAPLTLTVGTNGQRTLTWPLVPALDELKLSRGSNAANLNVDLTPAATKTVAGYSWNGSNGAPMQFYGLRVGQLSSNALLTSTLLNRLAYGPTPDELERVAAMQPQNYIAEQLAPEGLPDPIDNIYTGVITNGTPPPPPGSNGWVNVTVIGTYSNTNLYLYLTAIGEGYIDDIRLVAGTNAGAGPNLLANGDFELPLTNGWTVSANHAGSHITNNPTCQGNFSLYLKATSPGTTQGSAIWQTSAPALTNNAPCTLSYWYLPSTNYAPIEVRLSGRGVDSIGQAIAAPVPPAWVYFTDTGIATSTTLYLYLTQIGEAYVDDVKLVAGSVPEAGANLIQNGNFESSFPAPYWTVSTNLTGSSVSTTVSHSGAGSLHLVATSPGSTQVSSIYQTNLPITTNLTYTLSYWILFTTNHADFTARISGSGNVANGIQRSSTLSTLADDHRRLETVTGTLEVLRRWFCLNGIGNRRQLFEILTQFLENHFVTQYDKSFDYLNQFYNNDNGVKEDRYAADFEYREISRWRNAMLNPACTFYDLLKVSAESPAMIIYLDTVNSRGDQNSIANENYARELLELFTCGVDNGYDQGDIVQMSRAWTGWTVDLVDFNQANNVFAPRSTTSLVPGFTTVSNLAGVWNFVYHGTVHYTNGAITIFSNKVVDPRFGQPYVSKTYGTNATPGSYQLKLSVLKGTNGLQHGYDVIRHLADLPFTQEYISVKLCRLFVHDNFPNPTTTSSQEEYAYYDYRNLANLTPEARLVHDCMLAWESSNPKGQIRAVLATIFNSDLFRTHSGSMQKVKTPMEYCLSAVRTLRAARTDGTFTAGSSDGDFRTPMQRMGEMRLFNRGAPDGYPEVAAPWISAGTLAERLRYVQSFCVATGQPGHTGTTNDAGTASSDPVGLIQLKLPVASLTNAGAVADYFLSIIYPAEGKVNLDQYRALAVNFLNTANDGTSSPFNVLPVSNTAGSPYDTRVRGMVGMLMTLQRFHEQ
jgi:uncharacterized protein (DUF1800 family)